MTHLEQSHAMQARIQSTCDRLDTLYFRLKRNGLTDLSREEAEDIPLLLQSASSTLAAARGHNQEEAQIDALEARIFRTALLLRSMRRFAWGTGLLQRVQNVGELIWNARRSLSVSLLLLACGITLGYRAVFDDPTALAMIAPDGVVAATQQLADPILSQLQSVLQDLGWLGILLHPGVYIVFALIGLCIAAWMSVTIGGLLTPFLLVGAGGIMGGVIATFPVESQWFELYRLLPHALMFSISMMLSQSAGVRVMQTLLPNADGQNRYHRAKYLRDTMGLQYLSLWFLITGIALYLLAVGPWQQQAMSFFIALLITVGGIVWSLLSALRVWTRGVRPTTYSQVDLVPYQTPPPPVIARSFPLYLREGVTVHATVARLTERLAAACVDMMIVTLVVALSLYAIWTWSPFSARTTIIIAIITLIALLGIYSIVFEWRMHGQTPGKMIFELRTMRLDGEPLTLSLIGTRNLGNQLPLFIPPVFAILSYFTIEPLFTAVAICMMLSCLIPLLFPLFTRRRQQLGEFMTGTVTIELPDTADTATRVHSVPDTSPIHTPRSS